MPPALSLFDYFVLTYLAWGGMRGSWRGLYRELYGIISALLVLALLSGYGLISSVWHLVLQLNQHSLRLSGVLGYFMLLLATVFVLWRIRRRSQELKQGPAIATGIPGSILGALRTGLWSTAFIAFNKLLPLNLFEHLFIQQSAALRLLEPVLEFFHVT